MATVTIPARDGTRVDIDDNNGEPPKSGGIKDVYFTPDKKYAVAFFRKKIDIDAEDRLIKIVGAYRRQIFEHLGGSYFKTVLCWPERIVDYGGKTGIVVPRYDQRFYFPVSPKDPGEGLGGLEKEGKWFTSAKNLNRFVPPGQKGDLRGFLAVCLTLSRGVR